ncbi:MAG: hypothetical protein DWQ37_16505 [Planctomycetota bacterium]|nr:MAG: hypothetical protein DWQ37_16505 [Planctomycetota bacterium]
MQKVAIRSLLTLTLALLSVVAARAEELRWKFKDGEALNYVLKRGVDGKITLSGAEIAFTLEMIFDTTWKATAVAEDGVADVDLTVDRIQIVMDSPLAGRMAYDSSAEKEPEGPVWAQMGPVMKGMLGQTFKTKISPLGKVSDIQLPEKLQDVLGKQEVGENRRQGLGIGGNSFNAKGIKELIEQSVVPLPEEATAEAEWSRSFENAMPGMGTQFSETFFSYEGPEKVDGKELAKISGETEILFEPEENPRADLEIMAQESGATFLFDAQAGHLVKADGSQHLEMEITGPQEVSQVITEKMSMQLGKSPEKPAAEAAESK